jgi:7-cyano-7-deazaguanine synthase
VSASALIAPLTPLDDSPASAGTGALVLFSGGQDSTVCLAWALQRYGRVETIGFDYGQRHRIELDARQVLLIKLRALIARSDSIAHQHLGASVLADDHLIDLTVLGRLSETALTRDVKIALDGNGLPNTFVPGRNLIFLTMAAALAYRRGLDTLVAGMCETDFSGYPDCRDETLRALQTAVSLGMARSFRFETPLMWLDKAQTWALSQQLGGDELVELIRHDSHTCYLGERCQLHDWGYGCGQCPACQLRAAGYRKWQAQRYIKR